MKTYSAFLRTMPKKSSDLSKDEIEAEVKSLQLKMLRIQQGVFHRKDRVVIVFEGFDAAGKGGAIRKLVEALDPRSVRVVPVGPPGQEEQGIHWLYRFWRDLPPPGNITIFDRSWYGRVLVEKVDKLIPPLRVRQAYQEINQFETMLRNDGITVIKIFLAITKDEQLKRFEDRLSDPYKNWKVTMADVEARKKWSQYVRAVDDLFLKTNTRMNPWYVIPANSKHFARKEVLTRVTDELRFWQNWVEQKAKRRDKAELAKLLKN